MNSAYNGLRVVKSMDPVACNATWHSTGVDVYGFGDCLIVCHVGIGATPLTGSVYYTLTFEESDTLASSYTTIADGDIEGDFTSGGTKIINSNTKDEQLIVRSYRGLKRYVRITGTLTGSDTGKTTISAFVILANPLYVPTTPVTEV